MVSRRTVLSALAVAAGASTLGVASRAFGAARMPLTVVNNTGRYPDSAIYMYIVGTNLATGCDACVTEICAVDSYCCSTAWDRLCVNEVGSVCGKSCSGNSCAHAICTSGGNLANGCDPCVTQICTVDSYCCTTAWDSICVGEVASVCGKSCS